MGGTASVQPQQSKDASITLDKAHMYLPGQPVSGTVYLKTDSYKNLSVSIDLIGEVGYTMTNSSGSGSMTRSCHHMPFFSTSKTSIINEEKFSLKLDDNLPPSVNLSIGVYPYVRYFVQVNLSKGNKYRHYIIVCPIVTIPRSMLEPVVFNATNRKGVQVSGELDRKWVLPGETLQITFQIQNFQREHIKKISGQMFMMAKFTGGEYNEKVMDIAVDNVRDTKDENINGIIPLVIPSQYLPPSYIHTNENFNFHVIIEYLLEIEVHIKGAFNTLKTLIPLSVAFEPEKISFDGSSNAAHRRLSALSDTVKRTSLLPHHYNKIRYSEA